MTAAVLLPVRATFRAVATTVVPEATALNPEEWTELERIVEDVLVLRPDRVRRQLVMFLRVIEYRALLSHGRRFSRLGSARRTSICARMEHSRSLTIRRGFWGLRTLILMGYYTQPAVVQRTGYRAHPNGWSARRTSAEHLAVDHEVPVDL